MKKINPKKYNLSPRTILFKKKDSFIIIIDRKSRIIMKDGERLLKQAQQIKELEPTSKIKIATSAPICSKTKAYLGNQKIPFMSMSVLEFPS